MYLDEMYSPLVAELVRRADVSMVSAHEFGREGLSDYDVLLLAAREGRCVVTDNYKDFLRLSQEFYAQQLPHAGVLLIPTSVGDHRHTLIASAIVRLAREHPHGLQPYEVRWLDVSDL